MEHPSLAGSFSCEIAGMVEAQLIELGTAVQSVQAQLRLAKRHGQICKRKRRDWVELLVNGRLVLTRGTSGGLLSSMVQTAWRDWSVVFRSYAALVHPALKEEMQRVERMSTAETNAGLFETEQVQASTDFHCLLLHSTSGPALDRVVNAGSRRAPCMAAFGRKVRPTGEIENSRGTLELASM